MAVIALALVAAVVITVVLTRPDQSTKAGGEVFLQAAGSTGQDPFTESTAEQEPKASPTPTAVPSSTATANATRVVKGSTPGLYGGTRKAASCDVEKQISALSGAPDKNRVFASVLDIKPSGVPGYLRALTPVRLRADTRVTNHGYQDGSATTYQAVLQAGTAVLVDDRGVPRVRCACGNPLLPPVAQQSTPQLKGAAWPGYRSSDVVVVTPSATVVKVFVVFDPESGDWFARKPGDTGKADKKTDPPPGTTTSPSPSDPGSPSDAPSDTPPTDAPSPEAPPSDEPPPAPSTEPPPTDAPPSDPPPASEEPPASSAPAPDGSPASPAAGDGHAATAW
ncbi:hypothetical protein F0344_33185 [Streptomyces finlayi]|uniref:DUF6777 domain-containing protein n=1 Tax=Streptomyces finlayi TaxID=67296 RepID=A0A7G7BTZ5_9ACTN|nr:hypothetical protein F0344_33185 [Streptomyces finlayi]